MFMGLSKLINPEAYMCCLVSVEQNGMAVPFTRND